MGLLEKVGKGIDVLLDDDSPPPIKGALAHHIEHEKGTQFEKKVIGMFADRYFALHDWTRDTPDKTCGKRVESNGNPDLVMRYKPSDALIAVECKFMTSLYKGTLKWSTHSQLKRYNAYMRDTEVPVFIVIGLGGVPFNPDRMFCVPLEAAKYPALYSSIYEKYERGAAKNFFWDGHNLK